MTDAETAAAEDPRQHQPPRDPALDPANEHHHAHHHHTVFAEKGREDEVVYALDAKVADPAAVDASSQDKISKDISDVEDLGEGRAKRPWQRRVLKQWRHAAHAVIWLLFTGYVKKKKKKNEGHRERGRYHTIVSWACGL